jgi:Surface antigen variable number repeat/Omp85 superfamily domain
VEIRGATAFDRASILRFLRVQPGQPLYPSTATLAARLERRYRGSGYLAARVEASFDAATGILVLSVDEGRLSALQLQGLSGSTERRARQALGLVPGVVLKEGDVWKAVDRLETSSHGTVVVRGEDPFEVSATGEGARLDLHLLARRTRLSIGPFGPRTAGLYNRVDGFNPGLKTSFTLTDTGSYDDLELYGRASYALAADKARLAVGSRRSFGGERITLGYEFHDLTDTDDAFRGSPISGAEVPALFFASFQDYFRRRGHEAYLFARVSSAAQLGVSFRRDDYTSLPLETDDNPLFSNSTPRPNPPIDEGAMRSWIATARWTSAEALFGSRSSEHDSYLLRNLYGTSFGEPEGVRAETTFEVGSGDLDFRRWIADLRGRKRIGRTPVALRVLLGLSGGDPPAQKRFALGGRGTLRGYEVREFQGDDMLVTNLEWEAAAGRFPRPSLILFYDGGRTWGGALTSDGWKSGTGIGFEWSFSSVSVLRVDVGTRLGPERGHDRISVLARLRAPF